MWNQDHKNGYKLEIDMMMTITSDDLDQDLHDTLTDPWPVTLEKMTWPWWRIIAMNVEGSSIDLDTLASDQILFWKLNEMIKFDFETLTQTL